MPYRFQRHFFFFFAATMLFDAAAGAMPLRCAMLSFHTTHCIVIMLLMPPDAFLRYAYARYYALFFFSCRHA